MPPDPAHHLTSSRLSTLPPSPLQNYPQYANQQLAGANFAGAQLKDAIFNGANIAGASFVGASVRGATFAGTNAARTDWTGADMSGSLINGGDWTDAVSTAATVCPNGAPGPCAWGDG
jgi:uncharacterized protein YjbI with pentapeptide repeats